MLKTTKRLVICSYCFTTITLVALLSSPAHAQNLLYSVSRDDDLLRIIDPSTGSTISSVAITLPGKGVDFANGLATHPVTGELFALLKLSGQSGRQLVKLDPTTGVATSIGDTGDQFAGLAFNSGGTLYGVIGDKKNQAAGGLTPETLFTLNTTNAVPTQVLVLGNGNDGEAIGFNPNDGLLYHASGNDTGGDGCTPLTGTCVEVFESVNPNNLAVTNIPLSGAYVAFTATYSEVAALTHLSGNTLLLADIDSNLYQITTSGVLTLIGAMDHASKGLAFVNFPPSSLVAAVLPSSRSVQVGATATAFASIINVGSATAILCAPALATAPPATFIYQTTNPSNNQVTGSPNTPMSVGTGATQSFVIALTPTAPIAPTDVQLNFDCANTSPAPVVVGLNTLLFSASATPIPDIVALAATVTNDGIVNITTGSGAFAVATVNVGVNGTITASADTGSASLPLSISLCETNPATGQCISAIGPSVTTQINANATPTFAILVQGSGNIPFDPATNRIFVRFKDTGDVTRGSTSVAVRTQ